MLIGFVVFLLFPLGVSLLALRRSYSGLALLTFLSIFAGLGPLVAMLTLVRTSRTGHK